LFYVYAKLSNRTLKKLNRFSVFLPPQKSKMAPLLNELIDVLSPAQKSDLKQRLKGKPGASGQLVLQVLGSSTADNPQLTIKSNSAAKIQTQAKDIITKFYKETAKSPIATVQLVRSLIMTGRLKTAQKLYVGYEKQYLQAQNWQMLDFLYHEGFRLGQATGDIKFLEQVVKKRTACAARHAAYVELYGLVMIEMVRTEKFEERQHNINECLTTAQNLYKRAVNGNYPALIHNTLLIIYHIYSRYYNQPKKTYSTVIKMRDNHKKFMDFMDSTTEAVVKLNIINFLCIYNSFGSPEPLIKNIFKKIDAGGVLAKTNLLHAMLGYYLNTEDKKNTLKYLRLLETIEDKSHFTCFTSAVGAIQSFTNGQYGAFNTHLGAFYSNPNHINQPDSVVTLRLLELLVLQKEIRRDGGIKQHTDTFYFKNKIDALRVYFNRNLNKVRYAGEYSLLTFLNTPSHKNRLAVTKLLRSPYRNCRMLAKYVLAAQAGQL
jgi:uncharacterized protein YacL (UPF0231 family)